MTKLSHSSVLKRLHASKKKQLALFLGLPQEKRLSFLRSATKQVKKEILSALPEEDLVHILEALDPDKATDLLQLLPGGKREKALSRLSEEFKNTLSTLLEFDPETAAGLMTLNYIQVDDTEAMQDVAKKFRQHERRTGRAPVILVMRDGELAGFLPGHSLNFTRPEELIDGRIRRLPAVHPSTAHGDVVHLFRQHPHDKIAVLSDNGNVLGIIYSDDVLRAMHEKESASLYDFAGVSSEESVTDTTSRKVKFRYKWLIINLGTAFLAAFTVGQFEQIIAENVLLAVYMPIVAGMGGNAATQTLAVLVRGIALKQISLSTAFRTLRSEVGAGLINGLINGFIVAFIVLAKDNDWRIALILASAMVINLVVAAFFGTMVPLIMSKLKKDPAASATIFITTATDVLGFLTFLGLATLILPK